MLAHFTGPFPTDNSKLLSKLWFLVSASSLLLGWLCGNFSSAMGSLTGNFLGGFFLVLGSLLLGAYCYWIHAKMFTFKQWAKVSMCLIVGVSQLSGYYRAEYKGARKDLKQQILQVAYQLEQDVEDALDNIGQNNSFPNHTIEKAVDYTLITWMEGKEVSSSRIEGWLMDSPSWEEVRSEAFSSTFSGYGLKDIEKNAVDPSEITAAYKRVKNGGYWEPFLGFLLSTVTHQKDTSDVLTLNLYAVLNLGIYCMVLLCMPSIVMIKLQYSKL